MPNPSFNLDYLNEIFNGNQQNVTEVIALFVEELPVVKEKLNSAIQAQNINETRKAAHKIKSSLRAIGSHELAELAADIEVLSEGGQEKITGKWQSFQQKLPGLENELLLFLTKNK